MISHTLHAYERRAAEWHGWKASTARTCPRVLAGKRCQVGSSTNRECICHRYYWTLLDHARRWKTADREPILTGEPYGVDPTELGAFTSELADLGLTVDVHGSDLSPWNPGSTTLLVIRRGGVG